MVKIERMRLKFRSLSIINNIPLSEEKKYNDKDNVMLFDLVKSLN